MKDFDNLFTKISVHKGSRELFTDLLDALIFPFVVYDECNLKRNPINEYSNSEINVFYELLNLIGEKSEGYTDFIGEYFMKSMSNGHNNQYFTPDTVTNFISKTISSKNINGIETICDTSCGSGRMLISMAKENRNRLFFGYDIELFCVKMCVCNLLMHNLKGEVAWCDPLANDHFASFQICQMELPVIGIVKKQNSFII